MPENGGIRLTAISTEKQEYLMRRAEKYSETGAFGEWQRWVDENVAQKRDAHLLVNNAEALLKQ